MALLGAGTIPVTWTRAITNNFFRQRGLALGLTLAGTGICAALVPQYTTWFVQQQGWRAAYLAIAALPLLVALPLVYFGFHPQTSAEHANAATRQALNAGLTLGQAARTRAFWWGSWEKW